MSECGRVGDEDYDVDDFDEENLDNVLDQAEQAAKKGGRMAPQRFCPYLDSINRHILDFDFEKVCCVSNSHLNVYACLVCGKYFQGRARASPAYFHSLEHNHHVFMKLDTGKVWQQLRMRCAMSGTDEVDAGVLHPGQLRGFGLIARRH